MKLVITIDTEEDSWGEFKPNGATVENIRQVPELQSVFDEFGMVPTYLVTYPVATDPQAISILKAIQDRGKCEIGAHCHPWNTPPYEEDCNEKNSMICNLPDELQYRKIQSLHTTIQKNFGSEPVSFRAGRWGFDARVAKSLIRLDYRIDTSVTPYTDWSGEWGVDYSEDSPEPYRMKCEDASMSGETRHLHELPISVGYLQRNFTLSNRIFETIRRQPLSRLRLTGLLGKMGLLNKVYLSPELADSKSMILLAQRLMKNKYAILNLFFHTPSLQAGLTPFVRTSADKKQFMKTLRSFLVYARNSAAESITLSQAAQYLSESMKESASRIV